MRFASSLILADAAHSRMCIVMHLDLQKRFIKPHSTARKGGPYMTLKHKNTKNADSMEMEPSSSLRSIARWTWPVKCIVTRVTAAPAAFICGGSSRVAAKRSCEAVREEVHRGFAADFVSCRRRETTCCRHAGTYSAWGGGGGGICGERQRSAYHGMLLGRVGLATLGGSAAAAARCFSSAAIAPGSLMSGGLMSQSASTADDCLPAKPFL